MTCFSLPVKDIIGLGVLAITLLAVCGGYAYLSAVDKIRASRQRRAEQEREDYWGRK